MNKNRRLALAGLAGVVYIVYATGIMQHVYNHLFGFYCWNGVERDFAGFMAGCCTFIVFVAGLIPLIGAAINSSVRR